MVASMEVAMNNQYGRTFGHPTLVNNIARIYGPKLKQELNPMKNVLVTLGANGALCAFINALCNKGDEVVTFCPMFPMYLDHTEMAGATMNSVPLEYKDDAWRFDPEKLRTALSRP